MYTSEYMTLGDALLASGMGFLIVFAVLAFLAIVILVFSKVFHSGGAAAAPAPAAPAPVVEDASETVAIITSVICEELRADPNEITITGIREL